MGGMMAGKGYDSGAIRNDLTARTPA